jgi:hypothetical protein
MSSESERLDSPGWWARLSGDTLDLDALVESLSSDDLRVSRVGETYYLRSADFDVLPPSEATSVERRATEIVRVLNGALRVYLGSHDPVAVGGVSLVAETGAIQHFFSLTPAETRDRAVPLTIIGGSERDVVRSDVEASSRLGLVREDVERALRIFGREDVDWRDLYFVFEIVEASAGGRMFREGWITRDEARRFTHTANSPAVLADEARHGHEPSSQPPSNPMAFGEAKEAVRLLLASWLRAESSH